MPSATGVRVIGPNCSENAQPGGDGGSSLQEFLLPLHGSPLAHHHGDSAMREAVAQLKAPSARQGQHAASKRGLLRGA